jgi:hypothetical protein
MVVLHTIVSDLGIYSKDHVAAHKCYTPVCSIAMENVLIDTNLSQHLKKPSYQCAQLFVLLDIVNEF